MFSNSIYEHDYLFYACLVSQCTPIFDDSMQAPAGVSYNNLSYKLHINLKLFCNYSLEERLAILKHEMLHIVNGHLLYRMENRELQKFNIATDCAINQLIDENHLPKNCITPEYIEEEYNIKIKRLEPAEYYYDLLPDKNIDNIDNHDTWEYSDLNEIESQKIITTGMLEEAKEISTRIIGDAPGLYSHWIKIHQMKSNINWKKYLKFIIKNNKFKRTIYKPNRRHPDRMDLKGKIRDKSPNILYIIDASGSVKNSKFKKLNSEIISICSRYDLSITSIQVDYEASEPEILTKKTELIERTRNAGTFLSKGLQKAQDCRLKFDMIIVSTDGFLSHNDVREFENTKKTTIFLICKGGSDAVFKNKSKNIKYVKMI